MLTQQGQPIGLLEYATRIGKGKSTHSIVLLEWTPAQNGQIQASHLDGNENFREMELPTREAQSRFSYEICGNIAKLYPLFKDIIESQRIIQFPYHLHKDSVSAKKFSHVKQAEQHVIDMRPEAEKGLIKAGKSTRSLTSKIDNWVSKPELIA